MKSVRRNAEFTSFTSRTSAVAHIINGRKKGQFIFPQTAHGGEKRVAGERGEDRKEAVLVTTAQMKHVEYEFIFKICFFPSDRRAFDLSLLLGCV